jgi:hypothetical protein
MERDFAELARQHTELARHLNETVRLARALAARLEYHENGPLRVSAIAYDRAMQNRVVRPGPESERRIHLLSDQP